MPKPTKQNFWFHIFWNISDSNDQKNHSLNQETSHYFRWNDDIAQSNKAHTTGFLVILRTENAKKPCI